MAVDKSMRESPGGRSMISLYMECPRKWAWKYIKGFKNALIAPHFIVGQANHIAHEHFYLNGFDYNGMMKVAREYMSNTDPMLLPKVEVGLDLWYRNIGALDAAHSKVIAVEEEVYLTLPNGFVMTCRLDALLQDTKTEEVFIRDTKTTAYSLATTLRNYTYHDQPKLYFMAAKETFPDLMKDCRGWKTDGVYVKEKISLGEPTGTFYSDAQRSETVTFLDQDLEDTKNSYAAYTDDIAYKLRNVEEEGEPISINFPKCGEHCINYNKPCEFYNICHKIDTIDGIPGNFVEDPWLKEGTVLNKFRELEV